MKTMYRVGVVILFLLMTLSLVAQADKLQSNPSLSAFIDGKEMTFELQKLDVNVEVSGLVSETRMTMTFYNPYELQLEGEFNFPLPEGAFVSGYALDVRGKMVDGVIVEKPKARVVFEEIVSRNIDPGLVEWVEGNSFKTRVFPIFPKNTRTIMVRYISQLDYRKGKYHYHLPLKFKSRVDLFSLRLEVLSPESSGNSESMDNDLDFSNWKKSHMVKSGKKKYFLNKDIDIVIPFVRAQPVRIEKNPDGQYYFCIHDTVERVGEDTVKSLSAPEHITILWDVSGSRDTGDHQKELDALRDYFSSPVFKDRTVAVALVPFSSRKQEALHFRVQPGNVSGFIGKLAAAIGKLDYDGGTSMGVISPTENEKQPDLYLLFTDGSHNFGKNDPTGFKAPLYIISSSSAAKHSYLKYLANKYGGGYLNLEESNGVRIDDMMGHSSFMFIRASVSAGVASDIFPGSACGVGDRLTVTGRLKSPEAVVTLHYGRRGKILKSISYNLAKKAAVKGDVLRTFWAQQKVGELSIFSRANKNEILEMGKTYGLVTPGTSLMVLERLDQYIEFQIKPPKSLPHMREQYEHRVEIVEISKKEKEKRKLNQMLTQWQKRVAWWDKDYKFPEIPKITEESRGERMMAEWNRENREQILRERRLDVDSEYDEDFDDDDDWFPDTNNNASMGLASIRGTVSDPDGSTLPGITVILESPVLVRTEQLTTVSNSGGRYRFIGLAPGTYKLTFMLEGMNTVVRKGIHVESGRTYEVDITMTIKTLQETVVVSGQAPMVDRNRSSSSFSPLSMSRNARSSGSSGSSRRRSRRERRAEGSNNAGSGGPNNVDGLNTGGGSGSRSFYQPGIRVKRWNWTSPYLKPIRKNKSDIKTAFAEYMKQKKEYGRSSGFYLDCADYFFKLKQRGIALQILSNIAELDLDEASLLKILGHRLEQLGEYDVAVQVFERVLDLKPEEPQSYRDLALVLARMGQFRRAVDLLYRVVVGEWPEGASDIEMISLMEINHIIIDGPAGIADDIDPLLVKMLDVDMRIVLSWDSRGADIDLWVIDPMKEKAAFNNSRTKIGGYLSRDNTSGLGPEEFLLKKAIPGEYKILANYFTGDNATVRGPVTLQVDIFTNYGRKNEKRRSITLRLKNSNDVVTAGLVNF